jgi:hypothetical protein
MLSLFLKKFNIIQIYFKTFSAHPENLKEIKIKLQSIYVHKVL